MPRFKKGSPEAIKWAQEMRKKQREKALASTNQELISKDELARLRAKAGETPTITTTDAQTIEVEKGQETIDQAESEAEQDLEIEQAEPEPEPKQDPNKNYCANCGAEITGQPEKCPNCQAVLEWSAE